MITNISTLGLVTASQLARRLDIAPAWLHRKINSGEVKPDGRVGVAFVFKESRISALQRRLQRLEVTAEAGNS